MDGLIRGGITVSYSISTMDKKGRHLRCNKLQELMK